VHLKPVEPHAVTNLTVVTDAGCYYFRLTATTPKDKRDATYLLRFRYPPEGEIAVNPAAVRKPIGQQAKRGQATRVKVPQLPLLRIRQPEHQLVRALRLTAPSPSGVRPWARTIPPFSLSIRTATNRSSISEMEGSTW